MFAIAAAVGPCSGTHCSKQSVVEHVNQICKENSWPIGHHVLVKDAEGKWCYCTCSCLAKGSPVEYAPGQSKAIETYQVGEAVMAATTAFAWSSLKVAEKVDTAQIGQPNTVFVAWAGGSLTVTADHLFLVDGALLTADKLNTNDKLTAPDGSLVAITAVHTGDYFGSFHNVSTDSPSDPSKDMNGHLINSYGVISGDYAVQTHWVSGSVAAEVLHPEMMTRPVVGSLEYHALHPHAEPSPEALQAAADAGVTLTTDASTGAPGVLFVNREQDDAVHALAEGDLLGYVPLHVNGVLERLPSYPFSDAQRNALGLYLTKLFGAFYDDIDFEVVWWIRNVNVVSILAGAGERPRVVITGGALRLKMLDISALSLAIAFCVADIKASDENRGNVGYSDFYGAGAVMRNIWWDEDYITKMEQAVKEAKNLFEYIPIDFGIPGNPTYPSGLCRLKTYEQAMELTGIPDCATDIACNE